MITNSIQVGVSRKTSRDGYYLSAMPNTSTKHPPFGKGWLELVTAILKIIIAVLTIVAIVQNLR